MSDRCYLLFCVTLKVDNLSILKDGLPKVNFHTGKGLDGDHFALQSLPASGITDFQMAPCLAVDLKSGINYCGF